MNETLKRIIENYRAGLLSTPNIQVIEKKLSDETIQFPRKENLVNCEYATFKNSDLLNMKLINIYLGRSYFEKCLIENCIFENIIFQDAEFDKCVFKNCQFIDCDLNEVIGRETTFNQCTFLKGCLSNAIFEFCHFVKPIFEGLKGGPIGSAVLIDSTFSNSNKSIKFDGEVYFNEIFDQIDKLYLD
jgi:uncharacterized protein YjbI with pentapeptide repeats